MDFKKLYTSAEATALYNVAKIKYDPTSYSLKGNLITNASINDLKHEHIAYFDFDGERRLLDILYSEEGRKVLETTGMSDDHSSRSYYESEWAYLAVQQDNLYTSLELVKRFADLETLKSTYIMQTLVTMCVALNSSKSCAKDMLYLALHDFEHVPYQKIHTFEFLKDQLKVKGTPVSATLNTSSIDPTWVPTNEPDEFAAVSSPFKTNVNVMVDTLYAYLINSFEVMWAWSKLPTEYKDCFTKICNISDMPGRFDMEFFKDFFEFTGTSFKMCKDLENAISLDSPEERYTAYQHMASTAMYKHCIKYNSTGISKSHFLNPIISALTSFVAQIGLANTRINTIRILHEYCTTQGYLKAKTSDEDASSLLSKFGASLGMSATKGKPSKSLIDFDEHEYSKGSAPIDKSKDCDDDTDHDPHAMYEALDKVKASFTSGKYRFDVEDVKDTAPENKAKYDAIAAKVDMVNKLLIRRIKDIKTYNVGGKNSGMPSGRVDRKAIYRYKYDSNIFYNNTYKTLESDLAFGIILDESGSMSGRGIENGRITMIVLHETLKALGINHSIIGHTSDGKYHSEISRYQAFKEDKTYKVCKNYAIIKTSAKSGNCDSGALYYMEKALDRVRNKDKICLIFSDGAPTECTGTDLRKQVRHMEKKGIKVIGIGINFESIAKYYTEYANGRNLKDMLDIVAKILEEYVLKKKDK